MKENLVSAVVLAKNEEEIIGRCLKSLSWVDDLVVVDDNSSDKTVSLAEKLRARVFSHSLENNFSRQRNFGLEKARNKWVLFVDADEQVTVELKEEILREIKKDAFHGFLIKRNDFLWRKEVKWGELKNIWLLRLGKKDKGTWQRQVHESWLVEGKIGRLKNPLLHYSHFSLADLLTKVNFYSTLHANCLLKEGKSGNCLKILFYPSLKFVNNYFLKLGFLDGTRGLIINMIMSLHSFLAQGKLLHRLQGEVAGPKFSGQHSHVRRKLRLTSFLLTRKK